MQKILMSKWMRKSPLTTTTPNSAQRLVLSPTQSLKEHNIFSKVSMVYFIPFFLFLSFLLAAYLGNGLHPARHPSQLKAGQNTSAKFQQQEF